MTILQFVCARVKVCHDVNQVCDFICRSCCPGFPLYTPAPSALLGRGGILGATRVLVLDDLLAPDWIRRQRRLGEGERGSGRGRVTSAGEEAVGVGHAVARLALGAQLPREGDDADDGGGHDGRVGAPVVGLRVPAARGRPDVLGVAVRAGSAAAARGARGSAYEILPPPPWGCVSGCAGARSRRREGDVPLCVCVCGGGGGEGGGGCGYGGRRRRWGGGVRRAAWGG